MTQHSPLCGGKKKKHMQIALVGKYYCYYFPNTYLAKMIMLKSLKDVEFYSCKWRIDKR